MRPVPDSPGKGLGATSFETLVGEQAPALYRFALSLVRDPDLAQDLVQDTFVRAIERAEQFRGEASAATWLHRILHNLAIDRARRAAHELLVDEIEDCWRDDGYTVDAEAVVMNAEQRDELEDALVRLPFVYRAAVLLHDVEGWTVQEIADSLGIGLPAAKQRLRRARMMLVTALARGAERRHALAGVPLSCWTAREHVSDYLNGDVEPVIAAELEQHLQICPTCPPLYAALVGVRATIGGLRDPDSVVPPGLTQRIEQAVSR